MTAPGSRPRLIVGLGNPGGRYRDTRHNVGFRVLDKLADERGLDFVREKKWEVKVARHQEPGEGAPIWFAKPQAFMNLSGRAVSGMARFFRIQTDEILVVYDDVNLPLGTLRFRASGSAGGHNGIKSIIESLGDDGFPRLKLGIAGERGRPGGGAMTSHVLGRFSSGEKNVVEAMILDATTAVDIAMREGLDVAMNRFNQKPKKEKKKKKKVERPPATEAGDGSAAGKPETKIGRGESRPLQSGPEDAINTDPTKE